MSRTSLSTRVLSPSEAISRASSKVEQPVSRQQRPRKVPPPRLRTHNRQFNINSYQSGLFAACLADIIMSHLESKILKGKEKCLPRSKNQRLCIYSTDSLFKYTHLVFVPHNKKDRGPLCWMKTKHSWAAFKAARQRNHPWKRVGGGKTLPKKEHQPNCLFKLTGFKI